MIRKYTGHQQGHVIIRSCFGGVEESFIASGSESITALFTLFFFHLSEEPRSWCQFLFFFSFLFFSSRFECLHLAPGHRKANRGAEGPQSHCERSQLEPPQLPHARHSQWWSHHQALGRPKLIHSPSLFVQKKTKAKRKNLVVHVVIFLFLFFLFLTRSPPPPSISLHFLTLTHTQW